MLFDFGNLITLGIVILALILFRLLDKGNRSMDKIRRYADQCKRDIASFVEEKGAAITDYGIALEVERKAAMELMRHIQTLTKEELANKVQALAQIDDRIRDYDASLEELVQMTGRVQENLNRIREESAFVENVGKKISDARDKIDHVDKEIHSADKKLETLEERFEQRNSDALEKAVEDIIAAAKSAIADFEASAQTIERKIEDQREAADKLIREKEEKLAQTGERFEKLLLDAINRAGGRADKAEEAALAKLREQAQERIGLIKSSFEEKIKSVQETIKTKLGEIHDQVKANRDEWKVETAAIETRQKAYSAEWKKDVHEMSSFAQQQKDQWDRDLQEFTNLAKKQSENLGEAIQEQNKELSGAIQKQSEEMNSFAQQQKDQWSKELQEFTVIAKKQAENLGEAIQKQNKELDEAIQEQNKELSGAIQKQNEEMGGKIKKQREEWETVSNNAGREILAAAQEAVKARLDEIELQVKNNHDKWEAETAAIETRQNAYSADWKKDVKELTIFAQQQKDLWNREIQEYAALAKKQAENLSEAIHKQNEALSGAIKKQREEWETMSNSTGREIIAAAQKAVKLRLDEIELQVKNNRDKWEAETAAIESRQDAYSADWKKDVKELTVFAQQQKDLWKKEIQEFAELAKLQARDIDDAIRDQNKELGEAIQKQHEDLSGAIKKQRKEWEAMSRDIGQDIISSTQDRLDEYRQAQEEQFKQLSGVANDTSRLETELRRSMQEAMNLVNSDFNIFGKEIRATWENASGEFENQLQALRTELADVDRGLAELKEKAFESVSQKLKGFENEFLADLSRRGGEIDQQLNAWQETMDKRLETLAEESETQRQEAEVRITDDVKKTIAAQGEKLVSDLERLKTEASASEESIRERMYQADEYQKSFREQLERDLTEVKNAAESELNSKIGQYNLSVADTIRQNQRDLETQIQEFSLDSKEKITGLESSADDFRKGIEEWQGQYNTRMRELDSSMEDARRRCRELAVENDERISVAKSSLDEMRREIAAQTKLFDRTDSLKAELNRHVEDMSGNINRILQFKNEIAHFENQFTQIKHLEDDVNAKMTRFLSEKRRIEGMEGDFNRLLQTSQSVEEKLSQVSNSDDILQTMQVQLRNLESAIKETEEKYQRVERKNKALQETNDGIDRNFKALQEDEQSIKTLSEIITVLKTDMDAIQRSVETLSAENEKARSAAEKLSTLDEDVKWLEKRIAEMNVARESLGRLATELQNLDKDAQDQLNLTKSLLSREEGKNQGRSGKTADEGAPPPRDRENIIRLKRQGWSIDEIARSMKLSRGEVELILELGHKDV
jgi:chromosome segregation ATPase